MQVTSNLDVTEATVSPSFRSTPWEAEGNEDSRRTTARIAFVSESNVCRSVLAEALMERLLETSAVSSHVQVESRVSHSVQEGCLLHANRELTQMQSRRDLTDLPNMKHTSLLFSSFPVVSSVRKG